MKILEVDYQELKKDTKCLSILPIEFIEKYVGVPITMVSYGPDRSEVLDRQAKYSL